MQKPRFNPANVDRPGAAHHRRRLPWSLGWAVVLCSAVAWPVQARNAADAGLNSAKRCQHLAAQFDDAWPSNQGKASAELAFALRQQGVQACDAGRYPEGVHDLKRALLKLGLNPVRPVHRPHS
jgi:hypothetical protein